MTITLKAFAGQAKLKSPVQANGIKLLSKEIIQKYYNVLQ